jgi:cellulose synthase (UDP-forming)
MDIDHVPSPVATTAAPARAPETPRARRLIHASSLLALLVGVAYLGWRVTTLHPDAPVLSVLLLLLEVHAFAGLGLFTVSLWDVDGAPRPPAALPDLEVTVLIPTYDEPVEVLLPTIAAAIALEPAHETWVLDDGDRPEIAALCAQLGARHVTRPDHVHAKAGNLNHALQHVTTPLIAVLDADHVALPGFLERTLPYFHDDEVGLVQVPQEFYNDSSFEHVRGSFGRAADRIVFSEQSVFYREIQPGKNRWGGAFWCGTGAVVRVAALGSVGGVATSSITEDIQTTIRMHRRGWRSVYHDEVLALGLAASTAAQYALQRNRWCTGAMQVLRQERPLTDRALTVGQRLTYAATLLGWFDAVRLLGFLLLPPVVLVTGASPIRAPLGLFLAVFTVTYVLQQHALWRLSRGRMRPVPAAVFDLVRLPATLGAIVTGLTGRQVPFAVTPKGRTGGERQHAPAPRLLVALVAGYVLALAWYLAVLVDLVPVAYAVPGVAHGAAFWALVNGGLLVLAIVRVRSTAYAAERRASHRHPVTAPAHLDDTEVTLTDLSLTGARALATPEDGFAPGDEVTLEVAFDLAAATLRATVRAAVPLPDGQVALGLEFAPGQVTGQARLTIGVFSAYRAAVTGPVPQRSARSSDRAVVATSAGTLPPSSAR